MPLPFVKLHGLGNSYIYFDFLDGAPGALDLAALSRAVSDKGFGLGADGLIAILPSERADARMRIFNADGSEAEMCGNGIRCVGKYLYDRGRVPKTDMVIETGAGLLALRIHAVDDRARWVQVEMGPPALARAKIPMTGDPAGKAIDEPLEVNGRRYLVTALSMGNPHCVIFAESLDDELVLGVGPLIERHPAFPRRTNVEFVRSLPDGSLEMRVWERGSGETLACGTGACAAAVAARLQGITHEDEVTVRLRGGDLSIRWSPGGPVWMTGPAEEIAAGTLSDEWLAARLPA